MSFVLEYVRDAEGDYFAHKKTPEMDNHFQSFCGGAWEIRTPAPETGLTI